MSFVFRLRFPRGSKMKNIFAFVLVHATFISTVLADDSAFSPQARARIAKLERELSLLKAENKRLIETLENNGVLLGDAHQSIVTILKGLPEDLHPSKEWDKFRRQSIDKWLETEIPGTPFEAVLEVSKLQVKRNARSARPSDAWEASIYFKPRDLRYGKILFTQTVGENWPQPLHLSGDEDFAREMEAIPLGRKCKVMGKIGAVQLMPTTRTQLWKANISLLDYKVTFLK